MELDKIYNSDCLDFFPQIEDSSVDVILTDPPFLYLKNQKLERAFDEEEFFSQSKRVLKEDGFLLFFGRGESFYRWNSIVASLGFIFKEEIIWNKVRTTSPVLPLSRCHETIAVWTKKNGKIRRSYVPYFEKKTDYDSVIADVNRLKSVLCNQKELDAVLSFLETGRKTYEQNNKVTKFKTSVQDTCSSSRCQNVVSMIRNGALESSIISVVKNTYKSIHPTEKPVRLLERLISLVSDKGDIILDPFCGSGSTCEAAQNIGRHFIGVEIDAEYFTGAYNRMASLFRP